jgi:pro-kumamolisin-like protein
MDQERSLIPGGAALPRAGEHWLGPVPDSEPVSLTVLLRRRTVPGAPTEQDLLSGHYQQPSREAAQQAISADPADISAIEAFARQFGLTVASSNAETRQIRLRGTAAEAAAAFGVQLGWAQDSGGQRYLTYQGAISIPKQFSGIVTAVLGLDLHAAARHH